MDDNAAFPRLFTVEEAKELLPALRPLIEQILNNLRCLKSTSEKVIRTQQIAPDAPDLMDQLKRDDEITSLVGELKDCVDKINGYGCICKGVEQGLIDFPCLFGEEVVFLCWQIGETDVSHWHRIQDGFAGRKPLLDSDGFDPGAKTSYH